MLLRFVFIYLFLPSFVVLEDNFVYEYNPGNFRQQIEEMDGNFVMFYAPWYVFYLFKYLP